MLMCGRWQTVREEVAHNSSAHMRKNAMAALSVATTNLLFVDLERCLKQHCTFWAPRTDRNKAPDQTTRENLVRSILNSAAVHKKPPAPGAAKSEWADWAAYKAERLEEQRAQLTPDQQAFVADLQRQLHADVAGSGAEVDQA